MVDPNRILLGVNVDHVATLRQARGTRYPDPVKAALDAEHCQLGFHSSSSSPLLVSALLICQRRQRFDLRMRHS